VRSDLFDGTRIADPAIIMSPFRPAVLTALLAAGLAAPADAAVRLTTSVNGSVVELAWPQTAFPIGYKMDQRLVGALGGVNAIERGFEAWSAIPNTRVAFRGDGTSSGLRAAKDGQNVITVADDLFDNQRAVAITTNWDDRGVLIESDIQIDPEMIGGVYNIQQAITHEIGHLLGLDHSGVLSAVMYPFVSRGNADVELDSDDRVAIAAMYSAVDETRLGGALRGRVAGDGGGIFAAQVVAMNERGEAVATALTNSAGEFTLTGLPEGDYRIYAEPLDGPVDTRNLSPYWRQGNASSFPTQFFEGGAVTVRNGQVTGNLFVNTAGAVELNPRWIGVGQRGASTFTLSATAPYVRTGQIVAIAVAGDGMTPGVTTYEIVSPGLRRVSDFRYAGNYVYADWEVAADAPPGSMVVLVRRGNDTAALTGALRLQNGAGSRSRIARR
jgi:hypothetical protein